MKRGAAFSLIELTVVLGVIGTLTAALLIPMIKRLDRIAGEKEATSLRLMAAAFKERVLTTKSIPSETTWVQALSSQMGLQATEVSANPRRSSRLYLIDPSLRIGTNSSSANLPYIQPVAGSILTNGSGHVIPPVSPRFMFLSSISYPLPTNLASGVGGTSGAYAFTNIWETADGMVPAGWNWPGGDDLQIQRVDLSELFVEVLLNNRDTNRTAYYAIDGIGTNAVPYRGLAPKYFLKNTELKLINAAGELEYTEVLTESGAFTFELGTWASGTFTPHGVGEPGALDLQKVMNLFMSAPSNQYAQFGASQLLVSNAMVVYMSNFIVWRDAGYPGQFQGAGNPPNALSTAQSDLANVTSDLINPR